MIQKSRNITLWKQRASLVLVMFFCTLISFNEYLPSGQESETDKKEITDDHENQNQQETFLNIAVDAVVPFVTVLGQQLFYLIYENFTFEKPEITSEKLNLKVNLPYWEILLERIISTNAP